mgnify:CR=1 FL=1
MSEVEYEIKELIDEVLENKGYATEDDIEQAIDDIDFEDRVSNTFDSIDMNDHIDKDSIVSDAKDEAIDYIQDEIRDNIREELSESMDEVRDLIDQSINEYWAPDYIIETVNEAIVEGSINMATPQNVDSAPEPQGNLAFLKGALVCLTRYIDSVEGTEEE